MYRKSMVLMAIVAMAGAVFAKGTSSERRAMPIKEHTVREHSSANGRVPEHYRTNRDGIKENNWSQKGNVNPHTGKIGTKN